LGILRGRIIGDIAGGKVAPSIQRIEMVSIFIQGLVSASLGKYFIFGLQLDKLWVGDFPYRFLIF
jgi:hypothetical protein